MTRFLLSLAFLMACTVAPVASAQSTEEVVATIQDRAAAHGVSGARLVALARCESRLDPNARGDQGASVGLFQIHSQGLLYLFTQWGYADRANAWEAADFTARAIAAGYGSAWTCWGR